MVVEDEAEKGKKSQLEQSKAGQGDLTCTLY